MDTLNKVIKPIVPLQCGPAQLGREIGGVLRADCQEIFASMRPGPIGPGNAGHGRSKCLGTLRFNAARPNWAGKCECAEHRAGARGRFNAARPNWAGKCAGAGDLPWRAERLQCGPAQLGREIAKIEAALDDDPEWLQCGPAQLGREIAPVTAPVPSGLESLQCGPAQLGREMIPARRPMVMCESLQCGPAQLGREISRRPRP